MFCVNCGKTYEPTHKFCNHCGVAVLPSDTESEGNAKHEPMASKMDELHSKNDNSHLSSMYIDFDHAQHMNSLGLL